MTAGTVVITGGILATVILLCIIVVLCYCRLQYYCCKQNGSMDPDSPSYSEAQLSCDVCRPPGLDGSTVSPPSVSSEVVPSFCPTCSSFYNNSFYLRNRDETRNGAERVAYMLPSTRATSLSSHHFPDFYCNTHAISTDV